MGKREKKVHFPFPPASIREIRITVGLAKNQSNPVLMALRKAL